MSTWKRQWIRDVLGELEQDYIAEATGAKGIKIKRRHSVIEKQKWARIAMVMVACLFVVMAGVGVRYLFGQSLVQKEKQTTTKKDTKVVSSGVQIPPLKIDLRQNQYFGQGTYFVFQGNVYRNVSAMLVQSDVEFSTHLGKLTGLDSSWEPGDPIPDFCGTAEGNVYSLVIQDYDPNYVLGVVDDNKFKYIYIRSQGILFDSGKQIYGEMLHLSAKEVHRGICEVLDQTSQTGQKKYSESMWEMSTQNVESLMTTLLEGKVKKWDQKEKPQYHYNIELQKRDGVRILLHVTKDGCVFFSEVPEVYIQLPADVYREVVSNNVVDLEDEKFSEDAIRKQAEVVKSTMENMVLEVPDELQTRNVDAKFYFANKGKPYVIYGIKEGGRIRFHKYSLSSDYSRWVIEDLPWSDTLESVWPSEGEVYLEEDSQGNYYAIMTHRRPVGRKKETVIWGYRIDTEKKLSALSIEGVLKDFDNGKEDIKDVKLLNDERLVVYGKKESKFGVCRQKAIQYNVKTGEVLGTIEDVEDRKYLSTDPMDQEHYYLMDASTCCIARKRWDDSIPENLLRCDAMLEGYFTSSVVLNGRGYMVNENGIYAGSVTSRQWDCWKKEWEIYKGCTTKGEIKSWKYEYDLSERFEFMTPLMGTDRTFLMVAKEERCMNPEDNVNERWILY